jgi:hypothetical protein
LITITPLGWIIRCGVITAARLHRPYKRMQIPLLHLMRHKERQKTYSYKSDQREIQTMFPHGADYTIFSPQS